MSARMMAVMFGILVLIASGCGDAEEGVVGGETAGPTGTNDMGEGMGHGGFAFGEPASEEEATRTIEVEASDDLRFSPDAVQVETGETVTFAVTNTGNLPHDFVIGDQATQEQHEAEMEEMTDGAMMHHGPNAISIPPGETRELTWRFTEPGELLYGCHEPGHYESGMVGRVTVE
ncbi:MAG TPA: cupredoxin family protein [Egibacteraceae bacterium]|nr:cupredoxin family protein [Egibacteraceae bacterium]